MTKLRFKIPRGGEQELLLSKLHHFLLEILVHNIHQWWNFSISSCESF